LGADLLSIGMSGLYTSKKAMQTAGHNISNSNTEGYSRQRVNLQTNQPIGEGRHIMGAGVTINSIKRVHDQFLEKRIHEAEANHNFNEEKSYQLGLIEDVFNEINTEGLNQLVTNFFNSFRELSNSPENESVRSVVRENGRLLVQDFHRARSTLNQLQSQQNYKLVKAAEDVNIILQNVSELNVKIMTLETAHGESGDLRDQRDLAVNKLSKFFAIKTYADEKNQYVVNAEGVGSLVVGSEVQKVASGNVPDSNPQNEGFTNTELFLGENRIAPITKKFGEGKIKALNDVRTKELADLQLSLDEIAYTLAQSINAIHRKGYVHRQIPVDENGNLLKNTDEKITGINFFKIPTSKVRASEYISLSDEVLKNLSNITTSLEPNNPGDNRIGIAISKLQNEKLLARGTATLEDQYLKSVGNIALVANKSKINIDQSQGILAQLESIKNRVSGVSIDEETANLVKFQQTYNASAKVLKVADEMFDTVLGIKR
jgi:flagellar hook-associated protein 1